MAETASQKWQDKMDVKLDKVVDVLTNPEIGMAVRLVRVEIHQGDTLRRLDIINGGVTKALECAAAAKNLADDAASKEVVGELSGAVKKQWWFIATILLAILGLAFGLIQSVLLGG